jgi:hypothetical protein
MILRCDIVCFAVISQTKPQSRTNSRKRTIFKNIIFALGNTAGIKMREQNLLKTGTFTYDPAAIYFRHKNDSFDSVIPLI